MTIMKRFKNETDWFPLPGIHGEKELKESGFIDRVIKEKLRNGAILRTDDAYYKLKRNRA